MPAPRLTTDEYLRTPETLLPQELVYGYVRDAAAPTPRHQWAVGAVYRYLWAHLEETGAGQIWLSPIDVVLDRERGLVVQPDVLVVMKDRLHIVTDRVWGAPDLVVEVMSPHPRIGRREERLGWFAEYGVRECWLVQQLVRQIEVISFANGLAVDRRVFKPEEPLRSRLLPALHVTPASMLSEP
jgi:Uma2 family endonuclease